MHHYYSQKIANFCQKKLPGKIQVIHCTTHFCELETSLENAAAEQVQNGTIFGTRMCNEYFLNQRKHFFILFSVSY